MGGAVAAALFVMVGRDPAEREPGGKAGANMGPHEPKRVGPDDPRFPHFLGTQVHSSLLPKLPEAKRNQTNKRPRSATFP
ncbi:hypothetical protein E2562_016898 [Oryza meyeriana var. granulata]|uniref:Uncharacterized protein n=1 Tax=Oryza meyeriana var. granulata TaxID=110450 RepID=A0A6G1DXG0_9ORYZ|nr:hypothetical protein E2562_016898 [Oryza meyeriana var. granulata]